MLRVSVSSGGSTWFLGAKAGQRVGVGQAVSVSSGGSTWFLGTLYELAAFSGAEFQYPLADRLGFWGGAH